MFPATGAGRIRNSLHAPWFNHLSRDCTASMDRVCAPTFEASVFETGHVLYDAAARARPQLFRARGIRGALLAQALRDDALKRALFQFIDALPQLHDSRAVAEHFRAYLDNCELGG